MQDGINHTGLPVLEPFSILCYSCATNQRPFAQFTTALAAAPCIVISRSISNQSNILRVSHTANVCKSTRIKIAMGYNPPLSAMSTKFFQFYWEI